MIKILGKGYGKDTEANLYEYYKEYNRQLFGNKLPNNITIRWNNRTTTTLGSCRKTSNSFIIELSKKYHSINNHRELSNTLIHEMIHIAHTGKGHSSVFTRTANKLSELTGLNLTARGGEKDAKQFYKYEYKCQKCGRIGKANVKVDNQYICECKGELKTIKTL